MLEDKQEGRKRRITGGADKAKAQNSEDTPVKYSIDNADQPVKLFFALH